MDGIEKLQLTVDYCLSTSVTGTEHLINDLEWGTRAIDNPREFQKLQDPL